MINMEKKRILVVDDEESITETIKLILERTGSYEVRTLSSVKEIIPCIHTFKPDVILIDLIMPGMGGLDGCEMLASDSKGEGIPIIVVSGLQKDEDKLKAYKLGIVDYLTKPIKSSAIIASIERAIRDKTEED